MTTELAILMPGTGELIDPRAASDAQLAEARAYLVDLARQKDNAASLIDEEIIRRTDDHNRHAPGGGWTFQAGDYTVAVDSPAKRGRISTDSADALRLELLERADELGLSQQRIKAAFTVTYTAKLRELDNLAKLAPEISALVDDHTPPARRSVRVTRWRPPAIDATSVDEIPAPTPAPLEEEVPW